MAADQEQQSGQQVATQQQGGRLTVSQERALKRNAMIDGVSSHRSDIERVLKPLGVPFEFFAAGVQIGLNSIASRSPEFFDKVSPTAFLRECMQVARVGLVPDGKRAAIVNYGSDASAIIMVEGFVEVFKKSGVKDVNHDTVIEGDFFDYEAGSTPFIKHRPDLSRDSNTGRAIAAWCVIHTTDGGYYQEIVGEKDLERIAKTNKAAGARAIWKGEFDRKAALRRLAKRIPKMPGSLLEAALEIDDRNYETAPIPTTRRAGGIPVSAMFSDKRHVPQDEPIEDAEIEQGQDQGAAQAAAAGKEKPAHGKGKKAAGGAAKTRPAAKSRPDLQPAEDAAAGDEEGGQEAQASGQMAKELAATESLVDLGEQWTLVEKAAKSQKFSKETVEWLRGVMDGHRHKLEAAAAEQAQESSGDSTGEPAGDSKRQPEQPFELQLVLKGGAPPTIYTDEAAWSDAFAERLTAIMPEHHEKFWMVNKAFVLAALKPYPQIAGEIVAAMNERGFDVRADG